MITAALCTAVVLFSLGFTLLMPVAERWHDDGDCRGICWHTVRAPSLVERYDFWRLRVALVAELGDGSAPTSPALPHWRSTTDPKLRSVSMKIWNFDRIMYCYTGEKS
jgi:hypothetical protein